MPHITDSPGDFLTMDRESALRSASRTEGTHAIADQMANVERIQAANLNAILSSTASGAAVALRALVLSNDLRTIGQFDPANHAANKTVTVNQTTFIPQPTVGSWPGVGVYSGDDRNLWNNGTYRTTQTVTIDTASRTIVSTSSDTGTTHRLSPFPTSGKAPTGTAGGFTTSTTTTRTGDTVVTISGSSRNPVFIGNPIPAPAINYVIRVTIDRNGNSSIQVRHDGFPGYETRVNGNPVYGFDPRTAGEGPAALNPPMDKKSPVIAIRSGGG